MAPRRRMHLVGRRVRPSPEHLARSPRQVGEGLQVIQPGVTYSRSPTTTGPAEFFADFGAPLPPQAVGPGGRRLEAGRPAVPLRTPPLGPVPARGQERGGAGGRRRSVGRRDLGLRERAMNLCLCFPASAHWVDVACSCKTSSQSFWQWLQIVAPAPCLVNIWDASSGPRLQKWQGSSASVSQSEAVVPSSTLLHVSTQSLQMWTDGPVTTRTEPLTDCPQKEQLGLGMPCPPESCELLIASTLFTPATSPPAGRPRPGARRSRGPAPRRGCR